MSLQTDLEFNVLLFNALHCDRHTFSNYEITRKPEGICIRFSDHREYQYYKNDHYYIFKLEDDDDDEENLMNLEFYLNIRGEFKDFTEQRLIRDCEHYRHLFGTVMDPDIKRLIMFLYSIRQKDMATYVADCPPEVREQIESYVWGCLFSREDQDTSPFKSGKEETNLP